MVQHGFLARVDDDRRLGLFDDRGPRDEIPGSYASPVIHLRVDEPRALELRQAGPFERVRGILTIERVAAKVRGIADAHRSERRLRSSTGCSGRLNEYSC